MDISKFEYLKPDHPLKVVERDLSKNAFKPEFDETDLRIDHSTNRLNQNEIEIPVVKETFIHPFFLKGKLVEYTMKKLGGGFYAFVFRNGKLQPKSGDRRYPDKEIDRQNGGEVLFWIGYDHQKRRYYYIGQEDTFKERYQIVENALLDDEVQQLLRNFQRFMTYFLSPSFLKDHQMSGVNQTTVQDFRNIFVYLKNEIVMLRDYHTLLNIMDDIDDMTLHHNLHSFAKWSQNLDQYIQHIDKHLELQWTIEQTRDHWDEFKPVNDFFGAIKTEFWVTGYYIDPIHATLYPNFLAIHNQRQLAQGDVFESDETLRKKEKELYEKNIETAQNKQQVLFIKSD